MAAVNKFAIFFVVLLTMTIVICWKIWKIRCSKRFDLIPNNPNISNSKVVGQNPSSGG
ncbi:hypothetical protein RND71_002203 [Anisodus tanguticus]|uniref:Uncharacterized protein n=1 Tax=Anisodus tanguticus TaxID=243964 RepID=A0AAE1T2E8_9SOLA|nr:hypothetical protein RND71_002203 [Anisodus tanguticus]